MITRKRQWMMVVYGVAMISASAKADAPHQAGGDLALAAPPSVAALRSILVSQRTDRATKEQSLTALPRHGAEAVPLLLEFAQRVQSDRTWNMKVSEAMRQVLDRRLVSPLVKIAKDDSEPVAQAMALRALGAFIGQSAISVMKCDEKSGQGKSSFIVMHRSTDAIRAKGIPLTPEDRRAVFAVVDAIKAQKKLPLVVRQAVDEASHRRVDYEAAAQKAVSALQR